MWILLGRRFGMKIRITNGMNRRDVELPMSDSELILHMKQIGVDAVSYTHLDVYKRQPQMWSNSCSLVKT